LPNKSRNRTSVKPNRDGYFDYTLLIVVVFLILFGLLMIYSTSSYTAGIETTSPAFYVVKQGKAVLVGVVAMVAMIFIPYIILKKVYLIAYIGSVLLIMAVLIDGLGVTTNGATRWLNIFGYSLQPAEVAKVGVIIFIATMICKVGSGINRMRTVWVLLGAVAVISLELLFITDNLSSAIIVFGIAFFMIFVASKNYKGYVLAAFIIAISAVGIVFLIIALNNSQTGADVLGFRGLRILAWLEPEKYMEDTGMQTMQSLYAIGSGGFFGKGLGESMQKLGSLPEAHNDMIYAIICEELGLLGGLAVIILYIILLWRMLIIAQNTKDLFGALLVVGVMAHIAIQVLLNIAVVTNALPNTGVTLPFISYGGSSTLILMFEVGIVLNVSRGIQLKEGM
jgi:cell division protein FtsW